MPESKRIKTLTKEEIELEKARHELIMMKRPWFRKPNNIAALLPGLLGLFSIIYAVSTDLVGARLTELEIQKTNVQSLIDTLETRRDSLYGIADSLKLEVQKQQFHTDSVLILMNNQEEFLMDSLNQQIARLQEAGEFNNACENAMEVLRSEHSKAMSNQRLAEEVAYRCKLSLDSAQQVIQYLKLRIKSPQLELDLSRFQNSIGG